MKHPVSLVASLGLTAVLVGACGGTTAGKVELTEVCLDRMGGSQTKCSCYVDAIEKELSPDLFARVAMVSGGMTPLVALQTATMSCFA